MLDKRRCSLYVIKEHATVYKFGDLRPDLWYKTAETSCLYSESNKHKSEEFEASICILADVDFVNRSLVLFLTFVMLYFVA